MVVNKSFKVFFIMTGIQKKNNNKKSISERSVPECKCKVPRYSVFDLTHSTVNRVELFADRASTKIQVASPIGRVAK